jgi:hypothetical protein
MLTFPAELILLVLLFFSVAFMVWAFWNFLKASRRP